MDSFLRNFMDALPIFICVADEETMTPVYCNNTAEESLENMSEQDKCDFINDVLKYDNILKYCEGVSTERGRWFDLRSTKCEWLDGKQHILITGIDNSKSITNEELMTIANYTDSLTGIYNRKIGLEMLTKFVNELKLDSPPFTVCFVDLNDLKYVNDKYGHQSGDKYIKTVVENIKKCIRLSDVFARMGGDEFLVIFPKCTSDIVINIFDDVSKKLDEENNKNNPKTYYSISYGILEVTAKKENHVESILSEAGAIMYTMKNEYKAIRTLPE